MDGSYPSKSSGFSAELKRSVWLIGLLAWTFGVADRTFAVFLDGHFSIEECAQLFMIAFSLLAWVSLKPLESLQPVSQEIRAIQNLRNKR